MPVKALLQSLKNAKNFRTLKSLEYEGESVYFQGQRLLNLAGNDYLALAKNQPLKEEFFKNLQERDFYLSSSSSRSLSGNFSIYEDFENFLALQINARSNLAKTKENTAKTGENLAQIEKNPAENPLKNKKALSALTAENPAKNSTKLPKTALHFNSGYHLNLSCIQALSTLPNTLFIADKLIHASIIDGLKLGGKKFLRFKHNDTQNLRFLLEKYHKEFENIIIISEALFSMDGDFTPLSKLISLKKEFPKIRLYIDEAHSVGCFDESGLGFVKSLDLLDEVDFLVFTFGKAIASMGACMLCNKDFKEFFINKARAFIYSTALPPLNVAWTHFIFQNLPNFKEQRKNLFALSQFFKQALENKGFETLGEAYIISLLCKENEKADKLASKLLQNGFFAPAIKSPSVPENKALIRFSLNANLKEKDLQRLVDIL